MWEYDITTSNWNIRAPFPGGPRTNGIAFSISDKCYAGIGKEVDGKKQSFYEYRPAGPLSLEDNPQLKVKVYPNPIQNSAIILLDKTVPNAKIKLIDLSGRMVYSSSFSSTTYSFERGDLESGTYLLIIQNEQSDIILTKKIILQ